VFVGGGAVGQSAGVTCAVYCKGGVTELRSAAATVGAGKSSWVEVRVALECIDGLQYEVLPCSEEAVVEQLV
jgi:hypothetical protein